MLNETVGLWDKTEGLIVIKRKELKSIKVFMGTHGHECVHARSDAGDVSRDLERGLTEVIGVLAVRLLDD